MRYIHSLLVLALSAALPGGAQEKKDPGGIIQELDAVNGTITLVVAETARAKNARVRTYNIFKPDIPVVDAQEKPLKLTDLQPDDRIYFKLMDEDVVSIRLAPPMLHGVLSKIDVPQRTIVVSTKIGDKTHVVPEAARLLDGTQPISFEDLKTGSPLNVILAPDRSVVELRIGKNVLPVGKLSKGTGYVIDVDAEQRGVQIVVNWQGQDSSVLRHLSFAKEPTFGLLFLGKPHREMTLEELGRGVKAHFWVDGATRKVVHLEVDMPVLGRRVVKTIDRARRQIVLEGPDGERELALSKQVKVVTSEGPGRLEDVAAQSIIGCGLSADRKAIEVIRLWAK